MSENVNNKLLSKNQLLNWLRKPNLEKLEGVRFRWMNFSEKMFENIYGLEFSQIVFARELASDFQGSIIHSTNYQAAPLWYWIDALRDVLKTGIDIQNFIDIGSGKGKICFNISQITNIQNIIGVEFSHHLVDIAKSNLSKLPSNKIHFVCADATEWEVPDGNNIIFLANPFDDYVMKRFIDKNIHKLAQQNRFIIYCNDIYRHIFIEYGFETFARYPHQVTSVFRADQRGVD
jgi:SAM-dependent methyltransferase